MNSDSDQKIVLCYEDFVQQQRQRQELLNQFSEMSTLSMQVVFSIIGKILK